MIISKELQTNTSGLSSILKHRYILRGRVDWSLRYETSTAVLAWGVYKGFDPEGRGWVKARWMVTSVE